MNRISICPFLTMSRRKGKRTRHADVEVSRSAAVPLGILALAQPGLEAEDDGGPGLFSYLC